jgi:hypothetical protein
MDLHKVKWGYGLDWSGSAQAKVAGSCECGNERSVSVKMQGISYLAEDPSASQEVLCSTWLVA